MTDPPGADAVASARALVELATKAGEAFGRPDLVDRLRASQSALDDPDTRIVVAGEFKQGKSSLVNALLGAAACPVDDDMATARPTYVRHGETAEAFLVHEGEPPRRESIPLQDLRRHVVEDALSPTGSTDVAAVEVRLPRAILKTGLVLVDTPGVGGLGSSHAAASLAAISSADAVLLVTDASQELTMSERTFLRHARRLCDTVVCVLTKTDFYPAWRRIAALDEQHLAEQDTGGGPVPVLPVSSALRLHAVKTNSGELNRDSGFPRLIEFVTQQVAGGAARRAASAAATEVIAVCRQLEAQFEGEHAALADPAVAQTVVADLLRTKERAEELRAAAAKWQQTLGDGIADLTSDVDHDLRRRIRSVTEEADGLLEEVDPLDVWTEMQGWLQQAVSEELVANYTMLRDRAVDLSEEVAEHFRHASAQILDTLQVYSPSGVLASSHLEPKAKFEKQGAGKNGLTLLRNSYAGIAMFTVLGGIAHLALGPIAVGIGLVMGRKGLKDEKRRQLEQRRAQARNAVRRYCDDVTFVIGKDSRDTLRRIHRQLRDHYGARADELNRSSAEALRAASEAATRSQSERERRLKDVTAELARLRELRRRADALLTAVEAATPAPTPAPAAPSAGPALSASAGGRR
ncbi:MAG TPA: dynamin family protein [Kineosporiaceae bacterium]|nr:dynamin family protein [Kineosporiaceae bacterium]